MHISSFPSNQAVDAPERGEAALPGSPPVPLTERSLALLAFARIFFGLLWFQQLAWKMPPTFSGLHSYVQREAHYTFVPGYSALLSNVFLTHFLLLGAFVWSAELLVALSLIFGIFTRLGALLAVVLSIQLYVGLAFAPGEWYWTYGMLVLLALMFVAVPAGRRLGLDALLAPRLHAAGITDLGLISRLLHAGLRLMGKGMIG